MNKRRFLNILLACFSAATFILAGFVVVLTLTQTEVYTVESGSMSPAIKKGDAVFVRPIDKQTLQPGDIITAESPDGSRRFTHRITHIQMSESLIFTQGDANDSEDPMPTDVSLVVGKVWWVVPRLGTLSSLILSRGFLMTLAIAATLLMAVRMVLTVRKHENEGETDDAKKT